MVVLGGLVHGVDGLYGGERGPHSFAKTPLKAAHAPDVMAKNSQADLVGNAIVGGEVCLL